MKKFSTLIAAVVAALAVWIGPTVIGTGPVAGAAVCGAKRNVHCSIYWAKRTNGQAKPGARNSAVVALQKALQQLGYTQDVGTWGAYTSYNLKRYQWDRGLPQSGKLDAKTRAYLIRGVGIYRKAGTSPPSPKTLPANRAVAYAYSKIRAPYRYGGTGPYSFDCSGLTQASWRAAGVSIGRTTYAQYRSLPRVSKSALRPGDLVFFYGGGHSGVYVGGGYVIHSPRTGYSVAKVRMSSMRYYTAVRPRAWT